ncbi:NFACT family protein [Candidatus Woesearchaeota archaeon]|nr:NFACT family protein [Candidatus Woesearchaeota archaeon]
MKKQLSSIEINLLAEELQILINSRVDKIYHSEGSELCIQFYAQNAGKKILKIIPGKYLFLAEAKAEHQELSGFCMFLRKHLENSKLKEVRQIEPERIVEFAFEKAGKKLILIAEFFSKGNIIICDENHIIANALQFVDFSTRSIRPKIKYEHPKMEYDIFKLKKENLQELFKKTGKDALVTCLAVDLGLGGIYSEEICLLAKIDKNKKPQDIRNADKIADSIKKITGKKIKPVIYYENSEAVDAVPFEMEFYRNLEKKEFGTFNEALDYYFSKEEKIQKKPAKYDKDIESIKRIIEEQRQTIESMKKSENEDREKAELIYNNYKLVEEILTEINKASQKYSWKEIQEKLKEHKIIREVDAKEKRVVVEI